jgi:23S rRNA (uracil1939-C5)-methyltransferase
VKNQSRSPRRTVRRASPVSKRPGLWGKDLLQIERMSQEGRGVAMRDGKVVFVRGALAGEQVRAQCTAVKRDYDEADMLELAEDAPPSASRVQAACPLYQQCGGCSLQHWSVDAQREHKQATLLGMLQAIAPLQLEPTISGAPTAFRHRLRMVVTRNTDRSYALGLRQHRSHEAVNIPNCLVANPAVNALLPTLPGWLLGLPDLQGLREIDIDADSREQLGLCFYFAAHPGAAVLEQLRAAMSAIHVSALRVRLYTKRNPALDHDFDDTGGAAPQSFQELLAVGELQLRVTAPDGDQDSRPSLELGYLPGDFTQTHWEVNAALVQRAIDWLQPRPDEHALDLFCGIGNFCLPLACRAGKVDAYEGDSNMARRTSENAKRNGLTNITARTLDLMAPGISLPRAAIAIVDPPRAGAKSVCEALARSKVKRIVYVSCHAATLARDALILQSAGFKLRKAAAVDMFTHTGHSEAIALFERK